jgi:hypothetical protein
VYTIVVHNSTRQSVILSGVAVSRSEAVTDSKACPELAEGNPEHLTPGRMSQGILPDPPKASRECLSTLISLPAFIGSFDCGVVRSANDPFAQNDRFYQ